MDYQHQPLRAETVIAAAAITAHRGVGFDGAQATVAGQKILGVAQVGALEGEALALTSMGLAYIETGGAITKGAAVRVDASGRAVAAAALAVANPTVELTLDIDVTATVNAGATPVTSGAANGAIITASAADGDSSAAATQGAITGGYLPQFVLGDALDAASGAGEFIRVLLRR